jgi:hypothetical protein
VLVLATGGCRQPRARSTSNERVQPTFDKETGRLTRLEADSNGDGKIDTWGYMDGMRVVRVEVDENGDGKVDRWEFHRQQQGQVGQAGQKVDARPDKTVERIERATRFDGKVSRWEYFDNASLTRVEEDTDGDGHIDKWETYTAGSLSMMAIDTAHQGKPNRRLIYKPDGSLDRVEADPTGTGQFSPVRPPSVQ